ncbi:hypothetical protein FHS55_003381 [Angulomicrobium tetraedrale]|uniref:DUF1468 domain-containing protein n=1 Tax=Ancylobacter tetraedralis TaxID=217068 RepID=A0A839ZD24_9HYPH|nr:tripartite tricarboxylate transporter TctB family protein [Ancylobacter tetraedralis]MBB3772760.1 hypothetical protein [Ancylobacter tetraedralis]
MPITKDGLGGLIFAALGLSALLMSRSYPVGSALSMGPGYFPTIVSTLMLGLGVLLFLRSLRGPADAVPFAIAWRPFILITAAIAGFAFLIEFGIVVAVTYLVIAAWLADPNRKLKTLLMLIVIGILVPILIFSVGLKLPIKI